MIYVARLKELLAQVPDDAYLYVLQDDGEEGISINRGEEEWYIRTSIPCGRPPIYTEGFEKEEEDDKSKPTEEIASADTG